MKHWYRESPYCVLIQHSLSPITGINSAPRKLPRKLDKLPFGGGSKFTHMKITMSSSCLPTAALYPCKNQEGTPQFIKGRRLLFTARLLLPNLEDHLALKTEFRLHLH